MVALYLKSDKREKWRKAATTAIFSCDINTDEEGKSLVMQLRNGRGYIQTLSLSKLQVNAFNFYIKYCTLS